MWRGDFQVVTEGLTTGGSHAVMARKVWPARRNHSRSTCVASPPVKGSACQPSVHCAQGELRRATCPPASLLLAGFPTCLDPLESLSYQGKSLNADPSVYLSESLKDKGNSENLISQGKKLLERDLRLHCQVTTLSPANLHGTRPHGHRLREQRDKKVMPWGMGKYK